MGVLPRGSTLQTSVFLNTPPIQKHRGARAACPNLHAPSAAWEVPDRQRPNIHVAQLSEGVCAKGKAPHTKRRVVCSRRKGERARRRSMCEHVVIANSDEIDRQRPFCALSRPIPLIAHVHKKVIAHVHKKGLACHPLFRGLAQTPKNCFKLQKTVSSKTSTIRPIAHSTKTVADQHRPHVGSLRHTGPHRAHGASHGRLRSKYTHCNGSSSCCWWAYCGSWPPPTRRGLLCWGHRLFIKPRDVRSACAYSPDSSQP